MGTLSKKELVTAIEVLEMVPQIGGMTSSEFLRVSQKKNQIEFALASSMSGVVRITGDLEYGKDFYVARKVFLPFVLVGKDIKKDFQSSFSEGKWTLRQGGRRAEFVIRKEVVSGYGTWLEGEKNGRLALSDETKKMLTVANRCAGSDPSLPALDCVYLTDGAIMASNQTVVFLGKSKNKLEFAFPTNIIAALGNKEVESVSIEGNRVILGCSCGHLEGMMPAVPKKSFPKKNVETQIGLGRKQPIIAQLPCENFKKMMERMAAYIVDDSKELQLRIEISKGNLDLIVKMGHGVFVEKDSGYGSDVSMGWPLGLVKPVIDHISETASKIEVRGSHKKDLPYLISGAGVELLVARKTP